MAIHCTRPWCTPKSFCIVGIATLTMLMSSTDMNMPATSTTSGRPHPPWAAGGAGGAAGAGGRGGACGGAATFRAALG